MNNRQKGLSYCREVKKFLEGMNHIVEGPGYKPLWTGKGMSAVHSDFFTCFDLISFDGQGFIFHQVSDLNHKAEKIKAIKSKGMFGWVWCRIPKKIGYRIFFVTSDDITEGKAVFRQ